MGETLEALRRLQDIELQLATIRRKREAKARRADTHERKVAQADEKLEAQRALLRDRQVRLDALTLEISAREESTGKHREALNKAKTNKEYSAILAAMNTEKADTAKLENSILVLMEEIQAAQQVLADLEAQKTKYVEDVGASRKTLADYDAESKDERERLEAVHDEHAKGIAPAVLASFSRVAQRHDGEAMAIVTRLHPKREEYMCGGCNMKVTLETVNSLQTRDEIQLCSCCGRILHLEAAPAK